MWRREGGKGTPLSSVMLSGAAHPTQDGCTGKTFAVVMGGWGHARTALPPTRVLRRGICLGEKVGWEIKSPFIWTPSISLPPRPPLPPIPTSQGQQQEAVFVCVTLLLGVLEEDKGCRKSQQKSAAKMFQALLLGDAWLGTLVFICSVSEHSQLHPESVGTKVPTSTEWCKTSENSASCDHKWLHSKWRFFCLDVSVFQLPTWQREEEAVHWLHRNCLFLCVSRRVHT